MVGLSRLLLSLTTAVPWGRSERPGACGGCAAAACWWWRCMLLGVPCCCAAVRVARCGRRGGGCYLEGEAEGQVRVVVVLLLCRLWWWWVVVVLLHAAAAVRVCACGLREHGGWLLPLLGVVVLLLPLLLA